MRSNSMMQEDENMKTDLILTSNARDWCDLRERGLRVRPMWLMMGEVCETTNIAALENLGEKQGKIGKLDFKLQTMPLRIVILRTCYELQCKVGEKFGDSEEM